jgi:hypothetical protein
LTVDERDPVQERDHLGKRRLSGREEIFWYGFAALSYITASLIQKGLLNWLVGPAWLVLVVWLGPELVDRVRARR